MADSPPTKPTKSDPSPGSELSGKPSVVAFGFDVLDRIELAIAMVKERLRRAVTALEARGIPHAVVGGHAVAAWVARIDPAAVRTTVDVDLLVARADFDAVKAALESVGFIHSFTFGIDIFVDVPEGKAREAVHILFAGERVKRDRAAAMRCGRRHESRRRPRISPPAARWHLLPAPLRLRAQPPRAPARMRHRRRLRAGC